MKWRTSIESSSYPFKIDMDTAVLMLGSCFAEHIGHKLSYHKINCSINPTGITYNPISLSKHVTDALEQRHITIEELHNNGDHFVHFDFHGTMGHHEQTVCLTKLNSSLSKLRDSILKSDLLCISLGSAIVFELIENQAIVSNCHKFPQQAFNKRQLLRDEIIDALTILIEAILSVRPQAYLLFTVSPVRHARHGLIENNRSKANLISAVHCLCDIYEGVCYFPSYEIIIDDLRDYRFYKKDLVHPTETAIDYVWHFLQDSLMELDTVNELKSIQSLMSSYDHKPLTTDLTKQISTLLRLKEKMLEHEQCHRFKKEISVLEKRITNLTAS